MDAYQQQNRFMRPPPPSTADPHYPHHLQQQQQPPPPRQPGPWFPNQFQYHPSHSPSPPPPPPPQWPPHSDHLNPPQSSAYPPPPHHYSHQNQFPPPHRPYLPPPPPPPHPHSQVPQGYSQEWGNPNRGNHQAYPVHSNEEDWAARAKAWATAKTAMDNQHPQSQFSPASRPEEQGRYNEQYPQTVDSHYPEMVPHSLPASSYQQYPVTSLNRPPVGHLPEPGPFSYAPDGHAHFTARNGSVAGDSNAAFSHQESLQSPSAHQQEVPSSYSSVTGNEQFSERNNHSHSLMPFSTSSAHEGQYHAQSSAIGRSTLANQPYAYGSQSADFQPDLSDQPLDFAPRFNRDHDPQVHAGYSHSDVGGPVRGVDPAATMPSIHSWAPPIAPGYPPVPPVLPSGPQHDPSMAVPSPGSVHSVPPFGGFGGPSFQPAIPSAGTPYSLGGGNALHGTTLFPSDAYGISGVSERPKKAPVPNWLREEIIKKKAVITSSSHEHLKEETPSNEDEGVDRSTGKGDQGDSRSIESSRSTEEEDDDEDYVEAARTAAINLEIKRVLTEVLLKVTDELFDEIATKVLSEDDQMIDVDHKTVMSSHKVSPSPPAVPTPKASAKVLIPIQAKETNTETVNGKANPITPGDLLGLANYASDEDEEEEDDDGIESASKPNSRTSSAHLQSGTGRLSEDTRDAIENGNSQLEKVEGEKNAADSSYRISLLESNNSHSVVSNDLSGSRDSKEMVDGNDIADAMHSSEISGDKDKKNNVDEKLLYGTNRSSSKEAAGEKIVMKSERSSENVDARKLRDDPRGKETRIKSDKNDRHESKRSSSAKDFKEAESGKVRSDEKGEENRRRQDEKDIRKDQTDGRNGSKHRKEQGVRTGEKEKEAGSRKRSTHLGVKEERKEKERVHKTSAKEDGYKKRERAKDEDRSRKMLDSSRHKRRRSSSDSSRGRNSKDNLVDQSNGSSDESSDDSRRKLHSRKRNLSPSPVRSRRRQVSRSPHSKHSQRRHSPYSSLETTRGRRSRSKSPVRRQR